MLKETIIWKNRIWDTKNWYANASIVSIPYAFGSDVGEGNLPAGGRVVVQDRRMKKKTTTSVMAHESVLKTSDTV